MSVRYLKAQRQGGSRT